MMCFFCIQKLPNSRKMKKSTIIQLSIFLLFLLTTTLQAQIVNIPDANLKRVLVTGFTDSGYAAASSQLPNCDTMTTTPDCLVTDTNLIDINNDGEIQYSEALSIKWLRIPYSYISDLTGIEAFVNLVRLDCSGNNLTSVNLSNLANLKYLEISNNRISGNLDLSSLTNLKYFTASNNLIDNINVNGLGYLNSLTIDENRLTNINLNGLINLRVLFLAQNHLTNLNLSNLSNLKYINVNKNRLTNITFLNNQVLEDIYCFENQFVSLDLTSLVNLKQIDCMSNHLSSLLVNGLSNLETIICNYNDLTTLNLDGLIKK